MKLQSKMASVGLLLAALLYASPGSAQNHIQNGSFEMPTVPNGQYTDFMVGMSPTIPNWKVVTKSGENVLIISTNFTGVGCFFPAEDQQQWLDLTGQRPNTPTTGVEQAVTTIPGRVYQLSYWVGNIGYLLDSPSTVNVSINGTPTFSDTNPIVLIPCKLSWKQFVHTFTATTLSTTLTFFNGDGPNDDINGLDNVVLVDLTEGSCVQPPNTTMVAWYPFDEQPPLFVSTNLATANTGIQHHGPLGISGGEVGGAASLNGANQYVESPSSIVTNFGPGQTAAFCNSTLDNREGDYSSCRGNFSIDTWVNIPNTAPQGTMVIIDKRAGSPPTMKGYHFFVYRTGFGDSFLGLQLADAAAPNPGYTVYISSFIPTPTLYDGSWHHIAVTVDRTTANGITYYLDGAPIGNSTNDRLGSLANDSPLRIGTRTADPPLSGWFHGNLDELEIHNRVLSVGEVQNIFGAGSAGKCKPPSTLPSPCVSARDSIGAD